MATQVINLNNSTPAAPAGGQNVLWQADAPSLDPTVVRNVSAYLPLPTIPIPQSAQATAGAGQNQVLFSSLPVGGSVELYQDGILIAESLWLLNGFSAVLNANTFAGGAIVSASWQTDSVANGDVSTGAIALASTSTAAPVVRGTTQIAVSMVDSGLTYQGTLALPAGTLAGDLAVIMATSFSTVLGIDGWTINQQTTADAWNGLVMSKVLTSDDIAAGAITILGGAGTGYLTAALATFVGETGGVREADATQFNYTSSGSDYTSQVSTSAGVQPTDLLLLWAAVPTYTGEGAVPADEGNSIVLNPAGTPLQSSWSTDYGGLSMMLQSFTAPSAGVVTTTLTENLGVHLGDPPDGIYQATIAIEGSVVSSDFPPLPTWLAAGAALPHDEPLTDGNGNFIFAATLALGGDIIVVTGVPN